MQEPSGPWSATKRAIIVVQFSVLKYTDQFSSLFESENYICFAGYLNSTEDVNIISVSWPALSESLYTMSAVAVAPVGRYTGQMLDRLVSEVGVSTDSFHLVGHSLGAHICGVAGETFSSGNLSRISGKMTVRICSATTYKHGHWLVLYDTIWCNFNLVNFVSGLARSNSMQRLFLLTSCSWIKHASDRRLTVLINTTVQTIYL